MCEPNVDPHLIFAPSSPPDPLLLERMVFPEVSVQLDPGGFETSSLPVERGSPLNPLQHSCQITEEIGGS